MAPPTGNKNAMTHGRSSYLAMGRMPKGASYVGRLAGKLRKQIEQAVAAKFGEITLTQAGLCQSAMRHEIACLLVGRYLHSHESELSTKEWIALRQLASTETTKRDAAIRALRLDLADVSKLPLHSGYVTLDVVDAAADCDDDNGDDSDTTPAGNAADDASGDTPDTTEGEHEH